MFFCGCDGGFGFGEIFVGPCFYLDENDGAIGVNHDKVELAGFAGEVSYEYFQAFVFEEFLAAFFAPLSEQLLI